MLLQEMVNLREQLVSYSENTAEGVRARSERRGKATGTGGVQPGHVQNRALQQMAGNGQLPLRRPLPIRPRNRGAPPRHPPPPLQDGGLPDGPRRSRLPLRSPLPLPPCTH